MASQSAYLERYLYSFYLINLLFKAIETLQQLKTTFTPSEKMDVLLETFKEINKIGQVACGSGFHWNMDDLVKFTKKPATPLFSIVIKFSILVPRLSIYCGQVTSPSTWGRNTHDQRPNGITSSFWRIWHYVYHFTSELLSNSKRVDFYVLD